MARKGQKFKKYPYELKNKILKEYLDGLGGECSLAKKYDIPKETIQNWINKLKKGESLSIDGRGRKSTGRPKCKNLTLEDYKERYEILKKIPGLLTSTTREKVTFITIHINDYKLSNLCAALAISRRTYYKYRDSEDPDYYEYLLIKDIFDESKGTYGYRRVLEGLKIKYGVQILPI